MEESISNTKFISNFYLKDRKLLKQVWQNESEEMNDDGFKSEMLNYLTLYDKYEIKRVLVDSCKMRYVVSPDVQEWVNENVLSVVVPKIQKLAFLLPSDVFEQISIQQAMEDNQEINKQTAYFDSEEQAMEWLNS